MFVREVQSIGDKNGDQSLGTEAKSAGGMPLWHYGIFE
jgi:hypothetical protein